MQIDHDDAVIPGRERTAPPRVQLSMRALLDGGDWACSRGDGPALAQVAHHLAAVVPRPTQFELAGIAALAHLDLDIATARWAALADRLRHGRP
jgi:hypothetical protein